MDDVRVRDSARAAVPHEAALVIDRLARIRRLDTEATPALVLLGELRQLVGEAEAWARLEGGERGRAAAAELAERVLSAGEIGGVEEQADSAGP